MTTFYNNHDNEYEEEKVEDSFDFIQPKRNRFNEEVDFQSSSTHKKAAKLFAAQIVKDAGVLKAPVEVEKVVEFLNKNTSYKIDVFHDKSFRDRVSALTLKLTQENFETHTIFLNDNHHPNRQRFSFAHELGHIYFNTFHKEVEGGGKSPAEKDADFFASELMIPRGILKEDLKKLKDPVFLAKKYEVSKDSMWIKVTENNLIKYL
jgi:Zn-dependent peptidase ImmA (M78 family)